jgi:DNA topoisomerase-1
MEQTYIRVGNKNYEKLYGSYGLTTLKNKNVEIKKGKLTFTFVGKKGIEHNITLNNHKLAKSVKQCREIPGKELFQYYGTDGERKKVDSGMINNYIKEITGTEFSAKDFRTWAGTLQALKALRACGKAGSEADCKKNILDALDQVSKKLGNSRSICKKYYVHPSLLTLYENDELEKYCKDVKRKSQFQEPEECMLLRILKALMGRKA